MASVTENKLQLYEYQRGAVEFLDKRLSEGKGAALFIDMGLGKTPIVLTWLLANRPPRTLVIAPVRVANIVWPTEREKWAPSLSMTMLQGSPAQRLKRLTEQSDLFVISPDLIPWLIKQRFEPFDTLIIDESTAFKTWEAKRTLAVRALLPAARRRIIMSGTPASDSYADLCSQIFLLDDGESLGELWQFRNRFCLRGGFEAREWIFRSIAKPAVEELISPLVYRLDGRGYLDIPEMVEHDLWVEMPPAARRAHAELREKMQTTLAGGEEVVADSLGSLYLKSRTIANGGIYNGENTDRESLHLHTAKIDAVAEILDGLGGKPLLVFYQFQSDLERLMDRFPRASAIFGGMAPTGSAEVLREWNAGRVHLLLCQCRCVAHGLSMQDGGSDIAWLGLPDALEIYLQANARLHRHGQQNQVRIHRILAKGTVDEIIVGRIESKDESQTTLLQRLEQFLR